MRWLLLAAPYRSKKRDQRPYRHARHPTMRPWAPRKRRARQKVVLFFKISAQIIFRLLRRIHHGIIQPVSALCTARPGSLCFGPAASLRLSATPRPVLPPAAARRHERPAPAFKRLLRGPASVPIRRKPRGTAHRPGPAAPNQQGSHTISSGHAFLFHCHISSALHPAALTAECFRTGPPCIVVPRYRHYNDICFFVQSTTFPLRENEGLQIAVFRMCGIPAKAA